MHMPSRLRAQHVHGNAIGMLHHLVMMCLQLMNGAIWNQMLDAYYPEEVPIQRVRLPGLTHQGSGMLQRCAEFSQVIVAVHMASPQCRCCVSASPSAPVQGGYTHCAQVDKRTVAISLERVSHDLHHVQVDFFAYTYEQSMPNYKTLQVAFDRIDIRRVRP